MNVINVWGMVCFHKVLDTGVDFMKYVAMAQLDKIVDVESFRVETGIVYLIQNTVSKKVYVGITCNSFVRRYGMRFESHNEHLNRSIMRGRSK